MSEKSKQLLSWALCVLCQIVFAGVLLLAVIGTLHLFICE